MTGMHVKPVAAGVTLALAALLVGELHGLAFGAKEDAIKGRFSVQAAALHPQDPAKADKNVDDAWKYLKRAHEHYMGLGAAALALCLFIGASPVGTALKVGASSCVGVGALLYPLFWTLTALATPAAGGHAAKESLALLAQVGAGLSVIGLLFTVGVAAVWFTARDEP